MLKRDIQSTGSALWDEQKPRQKKVFNHRNARKELQQLKRLTQVYTQGFAEENTFEALLES
jgi:hypothetical protein